MPKNNPWKVVGESATTIPSSGERKLLSVELDHDNGLSFAKMFVVDNRVIVEGMDLLFADDYLALTKILIQRLTAKQVPV